MKPTTCFSFIKSTPYISMSFLALCCVACYLVLFAVSPTVFAYTALESLPGVTTDNPTLSTYLPAIYKIGIGLAGVLAVLMIVVGGIQYIGSGMSPSGKEDAKGRITNAIMGLFLALLSWLILNIINPDLIKIPAEISTAPPPSGATPTPPSSGCPSCTPLASGIPAKGPGAGCAKTASQCSVDPSIAGKLSTLNSALKANGVDWQITEMYPPTRNHKDPCHQAGTCIDASLRGISPDKNNETKYVNNIKQFIQSAKQAGLRPVYEVSTTAERDRLKKAGVTDVVYVGSWITGNHFSVYGT